MGYCKGKTQKGQPCRSKAKENGYCGQHQDQFTPVIAPETPQIQTTSEIQTAVLTSAPRPKSNNLKSSIGKGVWRPDLEIQTALLTSEDRVLRYRMNPRCPECSAHPTVCMTRRKFYGFFRCRICGHRFEVDRRPVVEVK